MVRLRSRVGTGACQARRVGRGFAHREVVERFEGWTAGAEDGTMRSIPQVNSSTYTGVRTRADGWWWGDLPEAFDTRPDDEIDETPRDIGEVEVVDDDESDERDDADTTPNQPMVGAMRIG
ncbi:hypothetical protein DSL72_000688 [Monilinia vaccinii-corymbosi]|uniref:Uncharacterized protein n=1 Tax=Monilinia vaccinii-corymbosi TaxID=61207 RepID=A0A8A3NZP7_9HELO|nr:hypothetical protein DSL72_000688 [Monilinia vaccinii-corymbosi]